MLKDKKVDNLQVAANLHINMLKVLKKSIGLRLYSFVLFMNNYL